MNAIGELGSLIIQYQNQIEIVLLLILAAAAAVLIVRAVSNARKKRQILSQISDTVSEINTAVSSLNQKKSDVIYIDNHIHHGKSSDQQEVSEAAEPKVHTEETAPSCSAAAEGENLKGPSDGRQEAAEAEKLQKPQREPSRNTGAAEEDEEVPEVPKRYFSRDCCTSKTGKTYTMEELERQIKE